MENDQANSDAQANSTSKQNSHTTAQPPTKKYLIAAIPVLVLILWFGYLYFVSGVLPSEEKYSTGERKALGRVSRSGFMTYERHGMWRTYHKNGKVSGEGKYDHGTKVESSWDYWAEDGTPLEGTERPQPEPGLPPPRL